MSEEAEKAEEIAMSNQRTLAEDEVLERQVFVNTTFTMSRGSGLRYCTLGNCRIKGSAADGCIERCLTTSNTDLAALWDMAATCDIAGHLAREDT